MKLTGALRRSDVRCRTYVEGAGGARPLRGLECPRQGSSVVFPNRGRGSGDPVQDLEDNLTKAIDDVAETLRWCKTHLHDRGANDAMRIVQLNLSYLALAIDYQMEGDMKKASDAIDKVWWQPQKDALG